MGNFIAIVIILVIIGGATFYIVKEKKNGVKCIGCPDGANCGRSSDAKGGCAGCSGNCGGNCHSQKEVN